MAFASGLRFTQGVNFMNEIVGYFITWTTYGTWLPGDRRGWRRRIGGVQLPAPPLEQWCRGQLSGEVVLLRDCDRETVERACREHARFRRWTIYAINARTNHVHVVISANDRPQKVRDQLKANATQQLRRQDSPLVREKTWTKGGDCQVLYSDEALTSAVQYVDECQDAAQGDP